MEVSKGTEFRNEYTEIYGPDCAHILHRSSDKTGRHDLESGFTESVNQSRSIRPFQINS